MKKVVPYILIITYLCSFNVIDVSASSGRLRKNSIVTCDGVTYGQHSSDNHWHVAQENSDGSYSAIGDPIYADPCVSSDNNSSSSDATSSEVSSSAAQSDSDNSSSTTTSSSSSSTSSSSSSSSNSKTITKSSDTAIKSIIINDNEYTDMDNIVYETYNNYVDIDVELNDNNASFDIDDTSNLSIGDNVVNITVTAEDGTTKEYSITVTVLEKSEEGELSSDTSITIIINDKTVELDDDNTAKVYVSYSDTELEVKYVLGDDASTVEIDAPETLDIGDNTAIVKVTAEDGTNQSYIITVHRYGKNEELIDTIIAIAIIVGIGYLIYRVLKTIIKKLKRK